jgi:hypothetical protein
MKHLNMTQNDIELRLNHIVTRLVILDVLIRNNRWPHKSDSILERTELQKEQRLLQSVKRKVL